MTNLFTTKTNFTAGELSQDLLGRVDLSAYENGAMTLKNVFIQPTGGVYRRPGLKFIGRLAKTGRLITYEKSVSETYLIVLEDLQAEIYLNDTMISIISTPWTACQINQVHWCQGGDALYLTHPDVPPQKLLKNGNNWQLVVFNFLTDNGCVLQPYHKFCDDAVTIASSGVIGNVTLTASANVFFFKTS